MTIGPNPGKRHAGAWTVLAFIVVAGALLLRHFGERFVFYYAIHYTAASLCGLVLLTPFVVYRMVRAPRFADALAGRYPTTWLRNWVVVPLAAALLVGMLFAAPLGWLFAAAAWSGGPVQQVHAIAAQVGAHARRKGCDQSAIIRFGQRYKKTCLDDLYAPSPMQPGEYLDVGIRAYPFGFLIVSITSLDHE